MFDGEKRQLRAMRDAVEWKVAAVRLTLHLVESSIECCSDGVTFGGGGCMSGPRSPESAEGVVPQ